ncbi:MAG: response regulator [Desulfamplus sp.]
MADVLIIDDDKTVCSMLYDLILHVGHESTIAHTLKDGLDALVKPFDIVFLDVRLPDGNALESLDKILALDNPPEIIIITGAGDPNGAELALKSGVWDYIQKPLAPQNILLPIKRVLQYREGLALPQEVRF